MQPLLRYFLVKKVKIQLKAKFLFFLTFIFSHQHFYEQIVCLHSTKRKMADCILATQRHYGANYCIGHA